MAARRPKRALRKRGLVVTEGTCTEPQYVDMLKRHFRGGQVSVKTVGVGQSPRAGSQSCTQGGETGKAKLRTI